MKIKVTVSGVMDLEPQDVKKLKKAGAEAVMDTMKFQVARLEVKIESVKSVKYAEKMVKVPVSSTESTDESEQEGG